ncbi:unnamed protein product [Protopolystoma xenopodis]|uniref:Uncharacterized protein n=1 Tax=Protopolystoma xenopodis TaxID=117903 RepID=A0A448WIP9_9PLAT|nr:unnamed protein product [Protopolystoma xenopodis]
MTRCVSEAFLADHLKFRCYPTIAGLHAALFHAALATAAAQVIAMIRLVEGLGGHATGPVEEQYHADEWGRNESPRSDNPSDLDASMRSLKKGAKTPTLAGHISPFSAYRNTRAHMSAFRAHFRKKTIYRLFEKAHPLKKHFCAALPQVLCYKPRLVKAKWCKKARGLLANMPTEKGIFDFGKGKKIFRLTP